MLMVLVSMSIYCFIYLLVIAVVRGPVTVSMSLNLLNGYYSFAAVVLWLSNMILFFRLYQRHVKKWVAVFLFFSIGVNLTWYVFMVSDAYHQCVEKKTYLYSLQEFFQSRPLDPDAEFITLKNMWHMAVEDKLLKPEVKSSNDFGLIPKSWRCEVDPNELLKLKKIHKANGVN